MGWLSVSFLTDASRADPLCDALMAAGALSASIEDADAGTPDERPQFGEPGSINSPGWDHSRVVALLEEDADVPALLAEASAAIGLSEPLNYAVGTVADQNWVQLTQSQFDPIRVSERLWIVPSWHESPDPAAINLILDPGMAFGTGSHPTTRLCLEWLERTVSPSCSVLDYGCGSGILAIAAARLGAGRVAGVDIDPQAVESARANAERNEVSALFADSAEPVAGEYDLVVANILSNPLRVLAPAICAHVRSGGCLALSGILREQAEEIIAIYAQWLPMEVADTREDWVCLSGVKP
ncbi:MAG: 50S ribosomal protein L11 methyltransferase [Betaproteobacteria bacterium]|jgi:ribosomal protein L11 methyltransferase|nr:50S ribosomal protein L11 methyltransferase [Betaproteobacteria bacterium]MBK8320061.1 50S ribosomal protein L11 methyltransferase [Betaproteobacteria bacterium]MBK9783457.1 50S ribosomal protein L11 methyltransferase [Candidatus Dechloromonas phosphorivorans]MBP8169986.1 50S ribosomal protein L11 methyltransferase [Azonexus sp.]